MQVSREELYEQVWSEPMTTLAARYGLSDVGLRKKCKKLSIPLPPQGYFLRDERRRQKANRTPLPAGNESVSIYPTPTDNFPPPFFDPEQYKEAEARIAFEKLPENRIEVRDRLTSPHPLIEKTRALRENSSRQRAERGRRDPCADAGLSISVSKQHLPRALRIMDALLKALESRGFKVAVAPMMYKSDRCATRATVLGVDLEFELKERFKQVENEPPKEDKKSSWPSSYSKYDLIPSGRFFLTITSYIGENSRRAWSDGAKHKVEDCLNDFIIWLMKGAVIDRARDLKRAHEENERIELIRRREEEARKQEEEKKRIQALISEAQSWKQSQLIREFIEAVRTKGIEKYGQIAADSDLEKWIKWANQVADRIDPLVPPSESQTEDK